MNKISKKPCVIIINGQSCTGKIYLLQNLSRENMTHISRDEIKEQLFDDLGIQDSEWSRKLGSASYSLFFKILEKFLISGNHFILEGNFNPKQHTQKFKTLFDKYGFDTAEILLVSDPKVLLERYKARWASGERHRGHADGERFVEFEARMKEDKQEALGINSNIIKIDTTDFKSIDIEFLKRQLINNIKN